MDEDKKLDANGNPIDAPVEEGEATEATETETEVEGEEEAAE